jgi:SAM-dependent methyltransferase
MVRVNRSTRWTLNSCKRYYWADDVTNMNRQQVRGIIYPLCRQDVINTVYTAKEHSVKISMRGTKHTMGAHTLVRNGYVLDMKCMNKILNFDKAKKLVCVEPGILWSDLIHFLNDHKLTPMTLQSYSSFSVGGTISVNAHGITNDKGMYNSIDSFMLINHEGQIINCSRDINPDLFSKVVGGYGLFGVITEVTLRVEDNYKLDMHMTTKTVEEFDGYYQKLIVDDTVDVKIARINITNFDEVLTTIFTRQSAENKPTKITSTISEPPIPSIFTKLMYKWLGTSTTFQKCRFGYEKMKGKPMDISQWESRNSLLYETVEPLAKLYCPLITVDRTHILQEFFVPKKHFLSWMYYMKDVFASKFDHISLLNITIRYLKQDDTTFLKYAKEDMYAFVLYYRCKRTADADNELKKIHNLLTNKVLTFNGTFYLPYRHHYNNEQLCKAYPEIIEFFNSKKYYDPHELFYNEWYRAYKTVTKFNTTTKDHDAVNDAANDAVIINNLSSNYQIITTDRNKSYQYLFSDPITKYKFKQFLTYVFNILPAQMVMDIIEEQLRKNKDSDDLQIYKSVQTHLNSRYFNGLRSLRPTLRNLASQKKEMASQTKSLLDDIGINRKFNGYVSFGDPGRYITSLQDKLDITGPTYIAHNTSGMKDIIENGSLFSVGTFVNFDYDKVNKIDVDDNSVDLVTCYIGLHHFTDEGLLKFIKEVHRILRPDGVFVLRDHNGTESLKPLLHAAHNIFNAVTGVTANAEKNEIRKFRETNEWLNMMTSNGFTTCQMFKAQRYDPTENYLMSFTKENKEIQIPDDIKTLVKKDGLFKRPLNQTYLTNTEWFTVYIAQEYGTFLNHTPWYLFPYWRSIGLFWKLYAKNLGIVYKKEGITGAFQPSYTLMNMVVGSVYSGMFSVLGVLSLPLRAVYALPGNQEIEKIRMLVSVSDQKLLKQKDVKVIRTTGVSTTGVSTTDVSTTGVSENVTYLEIPRYNPFKNIVFDFARKGVKFIKIAGNDVISLEVVCDDKQLQRIVKLEGVKFEYKYKILPTAQNSRVPLSVNIRQLGDVIVSLDKMNIEIAHIYDY